MSHPVIPAPVRFDGDAGQFAVWSGTPIAYTAAEVAPIVDRFCAEIMRRTGLRVAPLAGHPAPDGPSVRIEVAASDELDALPAPLGISPTGGRPPDERYSLTATAGSPADRALGGATCPALRLVCVR